MKRMNKIAAAVVAAALIFCPAATAASAAAQTVYIKSAADLEQLSKNCTLDSWSRGKTVVLQNDISLNGSNFAPIPTFFGSFNGGGHTISGLYIDGSGNTRGLFRYVGKGAEVKNLTVEGAIEPRDRQDELGLIAGSNSGKIISCTARGAVNGESRVGGIAGLNTESGQLVGCSFSGTVTGRHFVGGIVGKNSGTAANCLNSGNINASGLTDSTEIKNIDLKKLNSTENLPAYIDIGGIAGFSDGTLQSCENQGTVGMKHIGYNIGGIAGRQAGYLDACTNSAAVLGNKDVGGICGQLEPSVLKTFSGDFLDDLLDQLEELQKLTDRAADNTDKNSGKVSGSLHDLSDKSREAKDIASELIDLVDDWANGNIEQVNELTARISQVLDRLDPITEQMLQTTDDLTDLSKQLNKVIDRLEDAISKASGASGQASASINKFKNAATDLETALPQLMLAIQQTVIAKKDLAIAQATGADPTPALNELMQAMVTLNTAMTPVQSACSGTVAALNNLEKAADKLEDSLDYLDDALIKLSDAQNTMDDVLVGMKKISQSLHDMIKEQADKPDVEIKPIGENITSKGDALDDALTRMLDSADALNAAITGSADDAAADIRAVGSRLKSINKLLRSEKNDVQEQHEKDPEDRIRECIEDVSDSCDPEKLHDGRISASVNSGAAQGNVNVGGIAGSVGLESDFDITDDVVKVGQYSTDFTYQARAVINSCVNNGRITAKNNYAGGTAGRANMGLITSCEGYGDVKSEDGNYAGGIAGLSYGSIRKSWSKCEVDGQDYVGGTAGLGSTVENCHSLITVGSGAQAYIGAIAGDIDDDGTVAANTFVSEKLGAIDGISYAGKAEPVEFSVLCATRGVPKEFSKMQLVFRADGKTVATVPFQYGRGIDSLPEIPAKKGCSAAWPDIDYNHLTASLTLDAVYTPYRSAMADGQGLPQILVDGSFGSRAAVSHTEKQVSWQDDGGKTHSCTAYTVTVDDPDFKSVAYTVHYRLPQKKGRYALWLLNDGQWSRAEHTVDGSYLLFSSEQSSVTFAVEQTAEPTDPAVYAAAAAAAAVLALAVILMIRAARRKKAKKNK